MRKIGSQVMTHFRIVFAIILTFSFSALAAAQGETKAECEALDQLLKTVSLTQDMQNPESSASSERLRSQLTAQVNNISLDKLMPASANDALSAEAKAILQFKTHIQQDATRPVPELRPSSLAALSGPITPALLNSLVSLDNYWGCSTDGPLDTANTTERDETAALFGPQSGALQTASSPKPDPSAASTLRHMGQTSGRKTSRVATQSVKLSPNGTLVLMVAGLLALLGGAFLYVKRLEVYEAREARSLIHAPIPVRYDDDSEQSMMLVDISMNGAKIKHDQNLDGQDKVYLRLGHDWHLGHIKWQNAIFAGISFKAALDEATLKFITGSAQHHN